jgi:choline dehydrogenase-like flavoprotein
MGTYLKKQGEFVVVGSGPGGATVARQLAKAGKKVILLERGKDHRGKWYYGTHLGCLIYCDKMGLSMTEEGLQIVRGIMTGGSTNLFCGCASPPPEWLKKQYKINLDATVKQTIDELKIAPLPRPLWGRATQRVQEAAGELGYNWEPQPKFMNVSRGEPFDCGAKCMLGCRCGAKWTANEYVDEAVRDGCELLTGMTVKEILVDNGAAAGVVATVPGGKGLLRVEAQTVILAAGGIGSPVIMQHSGLPEAGRGMTMDTTAIVCGESRDEGMHMDPPMATSFCDDDNGYMLSTLIDPWMLYPLMLTLRGPRNPLHFLRYGKTMGVMIKLKDEISGGVSMEGKISKTLTEQDRWRLNHASNLARRILIRAGCRPDTVFVGPLRGTHPSGTVRIGELLDTHLESPIKGLYVSDASCFPEALDRPTVLTLIALSKRLAEHLLSKDKPRAKPRARTKTKAKGSTTKKTNRRKKKEGADVPEPPVPEPPPDAPPEEG